MSATILTWLLLNAILAALLAVPAALASRFLPSRPGLAHGLWLLVLLKLVTPPCVEVPVGWTSPPPAVVAEPTCPLTLPAGQDPEPAEVPVVVSEPVEVPPAPLDWRPGVVALWLGGAAVVWTLAAVRLRSLTRIVGDLPRAADIQDRVTLLCDRHRLARVPEVRLVPCVLPPLLLALIGRPRLLIPADLWQRLDANQRDALLLHELAHLARGDGRARWLELLAVGLYWWHPLAWWAGRALRDAEEACCDAWVLAAQPGVAAAYAGALVETVAFLSGAVASLPLGASGAAPVRSLYRRLTMILHGSSSRRLSRPVYGVLLVMGALVLPLVPTLAADKHVAKPQTVEQVIAQSPSCKACHSPSAPTKGETKDDAKLHDQIVRLLTELSTQRSKVETIEKELQGALQRFEDTTGKKPAGSDDRLDDLEKRLEGILKELRDLRGTRKPPAGKKPASLSVEPTYMNTRTFQIPIQVSPEKRTDGMQVALYLSKNGGNTYWLHHTVAEAAKSFSFVAPSDGWYYFRVESYTKDQTPFKQLDGPTNSAMAVIIDTVRPELRVSVANEGDNLTIDWHVIDENPDLQSLKLDYRKKDTDEWIPLVALPKKDRGAIRAGMPKESAQLRIRVKDLAGNEGEMVVPIKR